MAHYEILIVGGGPAGYTAALYAARSGRKTAVVEKLSPGGQMATTSVIDNYPGFPDGVDGFELGEKMEQQARKYGAETIYAEVTGADLAAVAADALDDRCTPSNPRAAAISDLERILREVVR